MTCPTCNDEGKVLSFYSRGPSSPPGNAYVGCPDCIKGQEYDMAIQHEMDEALERFAQQMNEAFRKIK